MLENEFYCKRVELQLVRSRSCLLDVEFNLDNAGALSQQHHPALTSTSQSLWNSSCRFRNLVLDGDIACAREKVSLTYQPH